MKQQTRMSGLRAAAVVALVAALAACGGGSGGVAGGADKTPSEGLGEVSPPPALPRIEPTRVELGQTHLVPPGGSQWSPGKSVYQLKPIGNRAALLMADLGLNPPASPWVEGSVNGLALERLTLLPPSRLPLSAGQGVGAYGASLHSVELPASWLKPGLKLVVGGLGRSPSLPIAVEVGMDSALNVSTLPFYLFGATEANTFPLTTTGAADAATANEILSVWPVSRVNAANHPARAVVWPRIVVGPRGGQAAYEVSKMEEQKDGYAVMGSVLGVLGGIRAANGQGPTNTLYYAPLLMLRGDGRYGHPGGGLGGGSVGTGDHAYTGIFIHEMGHALGLGHAGSDYDAKTYPYPGGSLKGSRWGYDSVRRQLVAPWLDASNSQLRNCASNASLQKDSQGHCYKQDNMQGGAGMQPAGYRFQMHADANAGRIQTHYLEGVASVDAKGVRSYSGGKFERDASFASGYSRWDSLAKKRVEVPRETTSGGLYGLDQGLPQQHGVPVHTIVLTYSRAGTPGASQIYPVLSYTGNLTRTIDPTDAAQRASVVTDTSANYWYCKGTGCDYTVRVTYADNSHRHVLLQGAFRPWFTPTAEPGAATLNPVDGASFKTWTVNVPGDKAIARVELLDTPQAWKGLPASPAVLLAR